MEGQVTGDVLPLGSQSMVLGFAVEAICFVEHRAAGHSSHEVHLEHTPDDYRNVEYKLIGCTIASHRHGYQRKGILLVVVLGSGCEFTC